MWNSIVSAIGHCILISFIKYDVNERINEISENGLHATGSLNNYNADIVICNTVYYCHTGIERPR